MKTFLALAIVLVSGVSFAKGLACGKGAMTPMEARLERASGNKNAESTRIQNAKRKSAQLQREVPNATAIPSGEKVTYQKVSKPCCNSKQTITASGGAKVGVGKTQAEATAKASKGGGKATW